MAAKWRQWRQRNNGGNGGVISWHNIVSASASMAWRENNESWRNARGIMAAWHGANGVAWQRQ